MCAPRPMKITSDARNFRWKTFVLPGSMSALERFRSVPRQSFVDDQLRRFATGYKANAVAALGTIGDPRSRAFLASLARNGRNPLAAAAQEALRKPREMR